MRSSWLRILSAALLAGGMFAAQRSYAQLRPLTGKVEPRKADAPSPDMVRIRKVEGLNRKGVLRTPVYQMNSGFAGRKQQQDWVEVKVKYDSKPEWIDELTIQFFVLSEYQVKGKFVYVLHRKTIRNLDVERGDEHQAGVYLSPNLLKRFGYPVAIAVEIGTGGKVVATAQDAERKIKMPEDWWKNDKVLAAEGFTVRDDSLLARDQTPFVLTTIDDYEVTR